mmetsp:Transcript_53798/g.117398  ORF Transcript_53798/g.117398 Transcript_53798/m.117398 type:complete len:211 (-) Transcript_53798:324-956(-)
MTTAREMVLRSRLAISAGRTMGRLDVNQRPRGSRRSTRSSFRREGRLTVAEAATSCSCGSMLLSKTARSSCCAGGSGRCLFADRFRSAARGPYTVSIGKSESSSSSTTTRRRDSTSVNTPSVSAERSMSATISGAVQQMTRASSSACGSGVAPIAMICTSLGSVTSPAASLASCTASSRVGATTSIFSPSPRRKIAGSRNASDFPEPVSA